MRGASSASRSDCSPCAPCTAGAQRAHIIDVRKDQRRVMLLDRPRTTPATVTSRSAGVGVPSAATDRNQQRDRVADVRPSCCGDDRADDHAFAARRQIRETAPR